MKCCVETVLFLDIIPDIVAASAIVEQVDAEGDIIICYMTQSYIQRIRIREIILDHTVLETGILKGILTEILKKILDQD